MKLKTTRKVSLSCRKIGLIKIHGHLRLAFKSFCFKDLLVYSEYVEITALSPLLGVVCTGQRLLLSKVPWVGTVGVKAHKEHTKSQALGSPEVCSSYLEQREGRAVVRSQGD